MNSILSAFLIVGGLGLLCALLLAIFTHFFGLKEEEKIKKIRECLPGANCGACGYSGCDQYARALSEGEAKPNLCIPGSVSVADKLEEILGIDNIEMEEPQVAYVKCNGSCQAAVYKSVCDNVTSCKTANALYGGPKACMYGCVGCGDCAAVCPTNAICIKDDLAHINPMVCIGCGMCVRECPKNIIALYPRRAKVTVMCSSKDKGAVARKNCKNACIGCKKCELGCPEKAIRVENNLAEIDYDKCTSCGKCLENCPTGCINWVKLGAKAEA